MESANNQHKGEGSNEPYNGLAPLRRGGIRVEQGRPKEEEKKTTPKHATGKKVEHSPSPTKSVKVMLTKPGKRNELMASIKSETSSAIISTINNISQDQRDKLDFISSLAEKIKPQHHYIDDDEEDYIRRPRPSMLPVTSVDDETFLARSRVDEDFLHHADDMLHMVLELPHGFHPRPIEDEDHGKTKMQVELLGLPGGLHLAPSVTKKYFGENARGEFFERYHWLANQRILVGKGCPPVPIHDENDDGDKLADVHHDGGIDLDLVPGEELIFDREEKIEEYIPFAPRRPQLEGDEDPYELHNSLSAIRQKRRELVAANPKAVQKIPTIEDILGSESRVLEALEANRAAEEAAIAAAAAEAEREKKRKQTMTAAGRRALARENARAARNHGRVIVPKLAVAPIAAPKKVIPTFSILQHPLQPKTIDTIVQLHTPEALDELTKSTKARLSAMTSEIDVSEDPLKVQSISDEARRMAKEAKEWERMEQIRNRMRKTIETWKEQAVKINGDQNEPRKTTMIKEKEDLNIKTDHVNVAPVKYVSGTKGKSLSISRAGSKALKKGEDKEMGTEKDNDDTTAGISGSRARRNLRRNRPATAQARVPLSFPASPSIEAAETSRANNVSVKSTSRNQAPASSTMDLTAKHQSNSGISQPDAPKDATPLQLRPSSALPSLPSSHQISRKTTARAPSPPPPEPSVVEVTTSVVYSLNGMLVGPGGILDESKYGHSTGFEDEGSVGDDSEAFPFKRSCASIVLAAEHGDDASAGNATFGMQTVLMDSQLRDMSVAEDVEIPYPLPSPRTAYIAGCMREHMNPRPSLVLRRNLTKKLELQHQGMGDEMAQILAESLKNLPFIQAINLTDNRLTDDGLGPLLKAALGIPGLLELNLSQNEIGSVAAECLFNYLCWSECPLQKLVLANADVDDSEAASFIDAVKANRSLKELILSNNLIGEAENYNTVFPDYTTGGEAIAELLSDEGCGIEVLRLDWNKIRLDSGVQIADSLAINGILTYLDLSYNTLGHDGGVALGKSLEENKGLKTLLVTNNSLDAAACVTICAGVIENTTIKNVFIDGNPIGAQGSKALMLVPMVVGSRVRVSASRCNISIIDPSCPYDFVDLLKSYELNMEDAFERAVLMLLTHVISSHHTFHFSLLEHTLTNGKAKQNKTKGKSRGGEYMRTFDLLQSRNDERVQYFDENQHKVLANLKKLLYAASDFSKAINLFNEIDKDGSGELDKYELATLMKSIGVEMSAKRIDEVMYTYDIDGGGNISIPEFLAFLKTQYQEAEERIKDLTEVPIVAEKRTPRKRFVPPKIGRITFKIADEFTRKKDLRVMTSCDKDYITEVCAGAGGDSIQMISNGIQNSMMRLDEGLSMFDTMMQDTRHKIQVLCKLLPQMSNPTDAKQLVAAALNYNKAEVLQLKRAMRYALKPILGDPNGYYALDLSDEMDRLCVTRLLEISKTTARNKSEISKIGQGLVGDLSQHGNWSCFRNEMFNGEHMIMTLAFANPLPRTGKLEFDFTAGSRPPRDCMVISDNRIIQVLINHFMLTANRRAAAHQRLALYKKMTDLALDCDGHTCYAPTLDRAAEVAYHQDNFYDNLKSRWMKFEQQAENEKNGLLPEGEEPTFLCNPTFDNPGDLESDSIRILGYGENALDDESSASDSKQEEDDDDSSQSQSIAEDNSMHSDSKPPRHDGSQAGTTDGEELESQAGAAAESPAAKKKAAVLDLADLEALDGVVEEGDKVIESGEDFMVKFKRLIESTVFSVGMKAKRIIEVLQDVLSRSFLMSRHIALIIDCFRPYGESTSVEFFGTYNAELVISFFDKIIDIHNFDLVLNRLTAFEVACLYCRLGILSIYNPAKPEGGWELNMSRWDERIVAKTLCFLATVEPGENWIDETFRHNRHMDPMPGWELVQTWLTDEGMPKKGIISLEYYSGECKFKEGCKPNVPARKSLFYLVLIEENELTEEGLRDRDMPLVGEKSLKANLPMWTSYLAPVKETDEKIWSDFKKLLSFNDFAKEQGRTLKPPKSKGKESSSPTKARATIIKDTAGKE